MDEKSAFLRRICEEPDEDVHRLVYADWLDENGEAERAEFIRVQVAIGRALAPGYRPSDPSAHELGVMILREQELLTDIRWLDWSHPLPTIAGYYWPNMDGPEDWEYTRGFVSHVTLTQGDFLRHAGDIFRTMPITAVTLSYREPDVRVGMRGINDDWFDWFPPTAGEGYGGARLAKELWVELLRQGGVVTEPYCLGHETRDEALAALSRACVTIGRRRADLPALVTAASFTTASASGESWPEDFHS